MKNQYILLVFSYLVINFAMIFSCKAYYSKYSIAVDETYPLYKIVAEDVCNALNRIDPNSCTIVDVKIDIALYLLSKEEINVVFMPEDISYSSYNGLGKYEYAGERKNFEKIAMLYMETLDLIVPVDSEINAFDDLKNKKADIVGDRTDVLFNVLNTTRANPIKAFDLIGVKSKKLSNLDSSMQDLCDNKLDGVMLLSENVNKNIEAILKKCKLRFVEIKPDFVVNKKYSYYFNTTIPYSLYSGDTKDKDIKTVGVNSSVYVKNGMSKQDIQILLDVLYLSLKKIKPMYPYIFLTHQDVVNNIRDYENRSLELNVTYHKHSLAYHKLMKH